MDIWPPMDIWVAPLSFLAILCLVAWCQRLFPDSSELTEARIRKHLADIGRDSSIKWLLIDRLGQSAMAGTSEPDQFLVFKVMGSRIMALPVSAHQLKPTVDTKNARLELKIRDITLPKITFEIERQADLLEFKSWLDQQGVSNA